MMKFIILTIIFLFQLNYNAFSQENCAKDWQVDLSTDPEKTKNISGDTHAAYAVYAFRGARGLSLTMKGNKIPEARFFSIQNYWSRLLLSRAERFQLEDESAFLIDSNLKQNFSIEISSRRLFHQNDSNADYMFGIRNIGVQAIMLRIYAPHHKISKDDLPSIYAYQNEKPTNCPRPFSVRLDLNFPQIIGRIAPKHEVLEFGPVGLASGSNQAIPKYVVSLAEIPHDRIALLWLKAPRQGEDVRYWSLCSNNFLKNQTLNCIADNDIIVDENNDRLSSFLFGSGDILKQCAKKLGMNFFEDLRDKRQKMAGFVYRNILPSDNFRENKLYQEEYLPRGVVLKPKEFICDKNYLESLIF